MSPSDTLQMDFYHFLEHSGTHFVNENGESQKIRSLSSDFIVFEEKCRYVGGQLTTDIRLLSFSGSNSFQMQSPPYTIEEGARIYLHQHDYFELMYVLEGIVPVQIENELYQFQCNDICLINRTVKHVERFDSNCTVVFICLPAKLAEDIYTKLNSNIHSALIQFFRENLENGTAHGKNFLEIRKDSCTQMKPYSPRETLRQMIKELEAQYAGCIRIVQGLLFRFFYCLTEEFGYFPSFAHLDFSLSDYIFEQINDYLILVNGQVNRKELELMLHYSADYLNKIIKRHCGMTLTEYGQSYRMKQAAKLICTTAMPISKISQELGFESKAYFYRLFEKYYHMSPASYRKYRGKTADKKPMTD